MQALRADGAGGSFFEVVRRLEAHEPAAARVGGKGPPELECVRFSCALSLAFADADVVAVEPVARKDDQTRRWRVETSFLGLYGPASPLPTFYTEDLFALEGDDRSLVRGFLDLFNHRALSLLYRAFEKYRYSFQFRASGKDRLTQRFLTIAGLDHLPPGTSVAPVRLLAVLGLITLRPRSAAALRGALREWFESLPVDIVPCVSRWLRLAPAQRTALARKCSRLGVDAVLGERVPDRSCTFAVALGPMALDDFRGFLPDGPRFAQVREIANLFNGDCLDHELRLRILPAEIPRLQLSSRDARLGWTSWLGEPPAAPAAVTFLARGWFDD